MKIICIILSNPLIYGSLCFMLGVLITAIINHFLAKSRDKRKEFNIASGKFRNIFLTELKGLYPIPVDWDKWNINLYLRDKFNALSSAVDEFRRHLPTDGEKTAFTKTWVAYYSANNDERCQLYHHYLSGSGTYINYITNEKYEWTRTKENCKENFIKNVEVLLEFAKQK